MPETHDDRAAELAEGEEPPPRGVRVMAWVRWGILFLAAAAAVVMWTQYAVGPAAAVHGLPRYWCAMHHQVVSDEPGECPICHMTLVPIPPAEMAQAGTAPSAAPSAGVASGPPGVAPLALSLDRIQQAGIRTSVAREREASGELRASAVVAVTDQGVAEVHARTTGFVDGVAVREIGTPVKRGQHLASFFSPEFLRAETELITASRFANEQKDSKLLVAARSKLRIFGLGEADADRIIASGKADGEMGLSAPIAGIVTKKEIVLGAAVAPETVLYEIRDLSTVYVVASVPEAESDPLRVGLEGAFAVGRDGLSRSVKIDLVYPTVEPDARTRRARMTLDNRDGSLHPGQYGTVVYAGARRSVVSVPRDAVIETGTSTYVFIASDGGTFTPRLVKVGALVGDDATIEAGVAVGERVVSGAIFLLDSESRLRASLAPNRATP